jgi:hypothetical protein
LVAVIYAAQVNSKLEAGNIEGAIEAARLAKIWFWVGLLIGLPLQLTLVAFQIFGVMAQMQDMPATNLF